MLYYVNISSAPTQPITVSYSVSGSADYIAPSGAVTFAAGQTDQFISIQTRPDVDQNNKSLTVSLASSSQYSLGAASAMATITDISHVGGRIFIAGGDISNWFASLVFGHVSLVYQTANEEEEYVIQGFPTNEPTPQSQYGLLAIQSLRWKSTDDQNRTHGQIELDLGGRDAGDVWSVLAQPAEQVDNRGARRMGLGLIPPRFTQNSNNVVWTLLHAVDVTVAAPSSGSISYPGYGVSGLLDLAYALDGTAYIDHLLGGERGDSLRGFAGNDVLDGGAGSDRLEGGADNDTYYFSRNSGTDTIFDTAATTRSIITATR